MPELIDFSTLVRSGDQIEQDVATILLRVVTLDQAGFDTIRKDPDFDSSRLDVCFTINGHEFPFVKAIKMTLEMMDSDFSHAVHIAARDQARDLTLEVSGAVAEATRDIIAEFEQKHGIRRDE